MKQLSFKISKFSKDLFFPKERIKSKIQVINILLEASRYILTNIEVKDVDSVGEIKLVINKMSRLFFISDSKSYSIVFPFNINNEDGEIKLAFSNNIEVNSYLISKTKSAINSNSFKDNTCVIGFADSILDLEDENEEMWLFLRELILLEDGYIRYDVDKEAYVKAKAKGTPHKHPIHHYDLFYTNGATFKIGLHNNQSSDEFIDLLDIKTDCKYLKSIVKNL